MTTAPPMAIVAGMATMPTRSDTARAAIASILPQVARLWLFLDRFDAIPDYARHEKILLLRSQEYGDLRANGKLLGMSLESEPCLYLSVDDDIAYPDDYAEVMIRQLMAYEMRAVVGVHASVMRPPVHSYRSDRRVYRRARRVWWNREVDILGTDCVAFATAQLRFDVRAWPVVNMVDLHFALHARRAGIPMVAVRRRPGWIRELATEQPESIYRGMLRDDSRQTQLVQDLLAIPRPTACRGR